MSINTRLGSKLGRWVSKKTKEHDKSLKNEIKIQHKADQTIAAMHTLYVMDEVLPKMEQEDLVKLHDYLDEKIGNETKVYDDPDKMREKCKQRAKNQKLYIYHHKDIQDYLDNYNRNKNQALEQQK